MIGRRNIHCLASRPWPCLRNIMYKQRGTGFSQAKIKAILASASTCVSYMRFRLQHMRPLLAGQASLSKLVNTVLYIPFSRLISS